MRIGIRLHDMAPGTLRERFFKAREQGYTCVHLALSKTLPGFTMAEAPALLTRDLAEGIRRDLRDSGQDCALLGCYLQLADADAKRLEKTREIYRAHFRFARMMGARLVGTETPAGGLSFDRPAPESEEAFDFFVKTVTPLVRCAEEEDVILGIEPVFCDIISTPLRAQRLLETLRSDHVGIILDGVNLLSNNAARDPEPVVREAVSRLGDRVALLHMKDFRIRDDRPRPDALACGEGSMRYETLIRFAKERDLEMTVEETVPENAVRVREYLEEIGETV